jgi:hypothetical protein
MQTIIGFLAGYLLGASEGKAGLERLKTSVNAIRSSPEVRKMASDAMVLAEQTIRRASAGGLGGGVVRTLVSRATARSQASRAA